MYILPYLHVYPYPIMSQGIPSIPSIKVHMYIMLSFNLVPIYIYGEACILELKAEHKTWAFAEPFSSLLFTICYTSYLAPIIKMLSGKAAVFVLVVFAVVCLGCVNGKVVCTEQMKKDLLLHCKLNIVTGHSPSPDRRGPCCQLVRLLQAMDPEMIDCIVRNLTDGEKHQYSTEKMLELKNKCYTPIKQVKPIYCLLMYLLLLHGMHSSWMDYSYIMLFPDRSWRNWTPATVDGGHACLL